MPDRLISAQAAIDAVNKALDRETIIFGFVRKVAVDAIKTMPATQPTQDCISRQAAIKISLEFFVEFLGGTFHENAQKELIARFQRLPSAQPQWIPCKDHLPLWNLTDVLLLYRDKRCGCEYDYYIVQAYTVRGKWKPALRIENSDLESMEPVAWMPLPEPYKEEHETKAK